MSRCYDRTGNLISHQEWARLLPAQQRVARDTLADGKDVSTVWLGLDHSFGDGPPLIFETMVFAGDGDMSDLDCARYSTEAEAIEGHAAMVAKWSKK